MAVPTAATMAVPTAATAGQVMQMAETAVPEVPMVVPETEWAEQWITVLDSPVPMHPRSLAEAGKRGQTLENMGTDPWLRGRLGRCRYFDDPPRQSHAEIGRTCSLQGRRCSSETW